MPATRRRPLPPVILALLALGLACASPAPSPASPDATEVPVPAAAPSALEDLRDNPLTTTRHGECRMDCRHITMAEVQAVLAHGTLVPERTRLDGECPSHAVEGEGTDGHRLRIVYAACVGETRVVTAIDLDEDWPCSCS